MVGGTHHRRARQDQDAALAAMSDWVAQYLKIAKVALRGKRQLLEKIGVTARTLTPIGASITVPD